MQELEPSTVIAERYRIIAFLAKGGMGAVYEVEHVHTGERLALKVLFSTGALEAEALSRFKREASAASRIKSEHVVRVTDAGVASELGGMAFLVMDLLEGSDLEAVCGSEPQSPEQVVEWLRQVARGLTRAHDLGLVHRDLKPQNLFLTKRADGTPLVKILDFGIVKHSDFDATPTLTGRVLGTPMYMAPEQAGVGDEPIGKYTDLYSLGLVAYRLLAGTTYRRGDTMVKLLSEVLSPTLTPPSERGLAVGAPFDTWFGRACAATPSSRFASATEQIESLAEALGLPREAASNPPADRVSDAPRSAISVSDTFTSAPTAVMVPPPSPAPRGRRWMAVVAVVALAALLGGALHKLRLGPPASVVVEVDAAAPNVGIADGPMSPTSNEKARAHFREAMRLFSLSSWKARDSFDAAVKEDPSFASAHLQRAVLDQVYAGVINDEDWNVADDDEPSLDVRAALSAREDLPDRDRGLLDVLQLLVRDPPDWRAARTAIGDVSKRFPQDAEIAFLGGVIEANLIHGAEAMALERRCSALDPRTTLGLWTIAVLEGSSSTGLDELRNYSAARRDAEACLARDGTSVACRAIMIEMDAGEGRCEEVERAGRELSATSPDYAHGYYYRAVGLAALDGSLPAMTDLLNKANARVRPSRRAEAERDSKRALSTYEGDLRAALESAKSDAGSLDDIELAAETGDVRGAAETAMRALSLAAARPMPAAVYLDRSTAIALRAAYEGKLLSPAEFKARSDAWVDSWQSRTDDREWNANGRDATWLNLYSTYQADLDRSEALYVLDKVAPVPPPGGFSIRNHAIVGQLLLIAGRVDEAIPWLELTTKPCMLEIRKQMRPWLALGHARALKGDKEGACHAFEKVLRRWGHAKPRSVTAEKARAESLKLGCAPVP